MIVKQCYMRIVSVFLTMLLLLGMSVPVSAADYTAQDTDVDLSVSAAGVYENWDGVSNVCQFLDAKGEMCLAYVKGKTVSVIRTKKGKKTGKTIKLKMPYSEFGGVTCDAKGNYYVVSGTQNKGQDSSKKTIYITKYSKSGKKVKSVGNCGDASLTAYWSGEFRTRTPFFGGNCDVAVNGKYLCVHYAREMYSGHQSNSMFVIDTQTMKKVSAGVFYQSHSFAQRVVPYKNDFILASEGDCYERAFTVCETNIASGQCVVQPVFDFWVEKGALDRYDMYQVNNNRAHMGGVAVGKNNLVAFCATSVKALSKQAKKQSEELYIQIFDPEKNLADAASYKTKGERSGVAGNNGTRTVTNHGVKWLTKYGKNYSVENPQIVATASGRFVVLFERSHKGKYEGVFYLVVNADGKVVKKIAKISGKAKLNPCRMPVYANGKVMWAANNNGGKDLYIHSFSVE